MRRYACRVKPEQRSAIFLVGHIFNYEAGCVPLFANLRAGRPNTPRILFVPGFPFTTFLRMLRLRLFTARHSYLINKLQLIAHAAVERIIRQSLAFQLGYVRLVLISATLYIQ